MKEIFEQCDKDRSGILDKDEFRFVVEKAKSCSRSTTLTWTRSGAQFTLSSACFPLLSGAMLTPACSAGRALKSACRACPEARLTKKETFSAFESWWKGARASRTRTFPCCQSTW